MPTSTELIAAMAKGLSLTQATCLTSYRILREASLVTKAGRGPKSAAKMRPSDAAAFLVGLIGPDQITDAAVAVRIYKATRLSSTPGMLPKFEAERLASADIPEVAALKPGHSYVDLIESLFAAAKNNSLGDRFFRLQFARPSVGSLTIRTRAGSDAFSHQFRYSLPYPLDLNAPLKESVSTLEKFYNDLGVRRTGYRNSFVEIEGGLFRDIAHVIAARE